MKKPAGGQRKPPVIPAIVSSGELAKFLGKTSRWIEVLTKQGVITKQAHGTYAFKATIQAYIFHLVEKAKETSSSGSADRLRESREDQIRLKMAKEDRKLITLEEAEATLDAMASAFLGSLDSIPARMTKDEKERARLREFIDAERGRLSALFSQEAQTLRTGVTSNDADEEDDV